MSKQTSKPRDLTPLTIKEVREIGRQLAYFAKQYDEAAEEMAASEIKEIVIKGAANLSLTIDRINGAVQSLQTGLSRTRSKPLRSKQPTIAESQADVLAQRKQQTKGRPKKQSSD